MADLAWQLAVTTTHDDGTHTVCSWPICGHTAARLAAALGRPAQEAILTPTGEVIKP